MYGNRLSANKFFYRLCLLNTPAIVFANTIWIFRIFHTRKNICVFFLWNKFNNTSSRVRVSGSQLIFITLYVYNHYVNCFASSIDSFIMYVYCTTSIYKSHMNFIYIISHIGICRMCIFFDKIHKYLHISVAPRKLCINGSIIFNTDAA